jgi:cytochrome b561
MSNQTRYATPTIILHWLVALLIVAAFVLGTIMTDMRISPTKLQYYSYHKWLGVTVLGLVALRLITRLLTQAPAYPAHMSELQKKVANGTHVFLYFLMFAVPLSGYVYTCAAGYPVVYLGLIELPSIIAPAPELKHTLKEVHEILSNLMLFTVLLHIAAAVKHQVIDKDGLMRRMMPGKSNP